MMNVETLYVFGSDYPAQRCWALLAWCRDKGAEEFTIFGIHTDGGSKEAFAAFDEVADKHRLPSALRYDMSHGDRRPTELWSLNDATEGALRTAFPRGIFDYIPGDAWFEDLSVYRAGALILGIITHEHEGVLRVTGAERDELDRRGFPYRKDGEWVGINEAAV